MSSPNIDGPANTSTTSSTTSPLTAAAAAAIRKRQIPNSSVYSTNETLNQMTQEAEARQQDKYTVQKEIRAIRAQEMEKQRKEDEEREKEEHSSRFNRNSSSAVPSSTSISSPMSAVSSSSTSSYKPRLYSTSSSANTSTTVNGTSNSRSDENSLEDNPRELKKKLSEMEDKYKKHAIYQTQLENDNQKLLYEVDLLKDLIEEHQELIVELRRQFKDKSRELDNQKRSYKDLQTDFARLKEILKQRDALIEDSGLVLYTDNESKKKINAIESAKLNGKDNEVVSANEIKSVLPAALVAPETAKLLNLLGEGTIDDKLRKLLNEKQDLTEHNNRLISEIEEERNRANALEKKLIANASKLLDNQESSQELHEIQRQYTKEINDLKMKLQRLEHENIIIKQDKQRLDTQLKYLQTNFDELENTERRLIKEKRETQRELNESKMLINDLQLKLEVLQKTLEKKRQTPKYIDTTFASLSSASSGSTSNLSTVTSSSSSSSTSLLVTPAQLNSANTTTSISTNIGLTGSSSSTTDILTKDIDTASTVVTKTLTTTISDSAITTDTSTSPTISSSSSSSSSTSPTNQQQSHQQQDTDVLDQPKNTPIKVPNISKTNVDNKNLFIDGSKLEGREAIND